MKREVKRNLHPGVSPSILWLTSRGAPLVMTGDLRFTESSTSANDKSMACPLPLKLNRHLDASRIFRFMGNRFKNVAQPPIRDCQSWRP